MRLPTVIIRDVLRVNSDEDIVRSLRTQNRHLSEGLDWDKVRAVYATGDGRAMTLSATGARGQPRAISSPDQGRLCIRGAQRRPVWDQSPLVQCSRCLGYGHGKRFAKKCPRGGVLLAAGALAAEDRTHTAEGSSTEGCTDRVSLRFMQSNLQRSKLATTELLVEAARRKIAVAIVQEPYIGNIGELRRYPGCRVVQKTAPRRGPVKAAIMVLNSDVDVEEDQTLNGENVAAAVIKAGNCRIGVVSVYFEGDMPIGPYLDRVRYVCSKLGTDKIILGGDVNAWSVWWGSERNDARGVDLCDFLDSEGCTS
ncbi:Putative 115 kDa protein in type-1 retrotransposable element R1DM [Eumeta japonica]|uniref:115 kDa protein in type-1 retrotransposable element R1DM n=1 Tax=Eumeta variegata TaxID=151549 RepID=A0A4C1W6Y0_EUMVA|nr:Putative 115 kDa protein in type-1 retrotransposable element R1DM [Eumeta japonica]